MRIVNVIVMTVLGFSAQVSHALSVEFHSTTNFGQSEVDKLHQARQLIQGVINSVEFKNRVLNFTYQGKKQFVQNEGMTNAEVYDAIMKGAEKWPVATAENKVIDLNLRLYTPRWYQSKNVIGYTSQSDAFIHINWYFYRSAEVYEIAMNLVHEWTHKVGFGHDYKSTSRRPYSVPYGIGYIIRDLGKNFDPKNPLPQVNDGPVWDRPVDVRVDSVMSAPLRSYPVRAAQATRVP